MRADVWRRLSLREGALGKPSVWSLRATSPRTKTVTTVDTSRHTSHSSHSHSLSLSLSLSLTLSPSNSQVTHAQCTAQVTVARETRMFGAASFQLCGSCTAHQVSLLPRPSSVRSLHPWTVRTRLSSPGTMSRAGYSQKHDVLFMRLLEDLPAELRNALVHAGLGDPCTLEDYPRMTAEEIYERGVASQESHEHATSALATGMLGIGRIAATPISIGATPPSTLSVPDVPVVPASCSWIVPIPIPHMRTKTDVLRPPGPLQAPFPTTSSTCSSLLWVSARLQSSVFCSGSVPIGAAGWTSSGDCSRLQGYYPLRSRFGSGVLAPHGLVLDR